MTMMTRMISAATQLTLLLSAFGGYPVAFNASTNFGGSQPSIVTVPIFVTTSLPGTAGTDVNDRPALPRKSLARSHAGCRDHGPRKIWKLQSRAATSIGVRCWQASTCELSMGVRLLDSRN